ncbi:MAG: hypothetical protein KAW12_01260 [Candidatus Aminicenantes bacterium]|nr:hypothetical protein [Candidatus Aminicenantes bacterium]
MTQDPEIVAISRVFEALRELNNPQRKRIIDWATDKFGLLDEKAEAASETPSAVETPAPDTTPEAPAELETTVTAAPPVVTAEPVRDSKFQEYKTMEDLFLVATVKKNPAKVLLSAAFLQENSRVADLTTRVINAALREIGFGVPNITACLGSLVNKKFMVLLEPTGTAQRGKNKFQVTPAGLKAAKKLF